MVDPVIVGSVALDSIETPFGKVNDVLGGAATYASFSSSFFSNPGVVAVVGDDFPKKHLDLLEKAGVDLTGVKVEGVSFRWQGLYEYDMNEAKTLKTELGSFEAFKPKLPENYRRAKFVFLANIDPELQLNVLGQIENPTLTVMDTMNFWINTKKQELLQVMKKIDILLLNDSEARQLFNTPNLVVAAKQALDLGPKYVIIKKGEHGALMFSRKGHFNAPGYPLEVVRDPTGSGDSFAGALIGYLARTDDISESNIRKAVIYGSVVASFNAEDFSLDRLKNITLKDIESRYEEFIRIREF